MNVLFIHNAVISILEISLVRSWVDGNADLAYWLLTTCELSYANAMKLIKRKIDFVSGRIVGKQAVKRFVENDPSLWSEMREVNLRFLDIEIRRAITGAPRVLINNLPVKMHLSISHSPRYAVATVCSQEHYFGIGIDIERIERRDEALLDVAFRAKELQTMKAHSEQQKGNLDEYITRYWTIKEAALKSMGIGLTVDLKDIEVIENDCGVVRLGFENEVQERFVELGRHPIEIMSYLLDDQVLSIARMQK